jgi:hypothetical protein
LASKQEKGPKRNLVDSFSWRDGTEDLRRLAWLEFSGQSTREKASAQKENSGNIQSPLSIQ